MPWGINKSFSVLFLGLKLVNQNVMYKLRCSFLCIGDVQKQTVNKEMVHEPMISYFVTFKILCSFRDKLKFKSGQSNVS